MWVLASALTWLRLPAAARDTFWAEDGHQFVADWLHDAGPATLFQGYGGYLHLLPRGITWLVVEFVPVDAWAFATTAAACVVTGGVAALVFVFSQDVVAASVARIGLALVVVLTPLAGMEILGNVANVHWYLLYLTPWLLLATPRSRVGSVAMVLLAAGRHADRAAEHSLCAAGRLAVPEGSCVRGRWWVVTPSGWRRRC